MLVHRNWATKTEKVFALDQVKELVGNRDVFPVHRLDRPTSGLLVFALDSNIAHDMCEKFAQRTVHKEYLAVVRGWADEKGFIDHPLKRVENKYQKNTNAVVYTTNAKINESTNKKCQRQGEKSLIENDDAVDDDVEDDDTGGDRVQEAQTEYTCLHKAELPFSVSKKFATSRFSLVKLNPRTGLLAFCQFRCTLLLHYFTKKN
jgi:tRNA pseudouridine65 synthase